MRIIVDGRFFRCDLILFIRLSTFATFLLKSVSRFTDLFTVVKSHRINEKKYTTIYGGHLGTWMFVNKSKPGLWHVFTKSNRSFEISFSESVEKNRFLCFIDETGSVFQLVRVPHESPIGKKVIGHFL